MIKNHKQGIHEDTDRCILFSACDDCYYYKLYESVQKIVLKCTNCCREVPNKEHLTKRGCKWCINEKM